ncbi:hypothetical protein LTR03_017673, partial [Friedmanniomyces endolithicus]
LRTLAVDRFQHAEDRKNALLRDELGDSLRQEAFLQRDFTRLTTEHLAQMTRVLTVAVHALETEVARLLLASSYEAQVRECQRLREGLPRELISSQQQHRTSLPPLAPAPIVHAQPPGAGHSRAATQDENTGVKAVLTYITNLELTPQSVRSVEGDGDGDGDGVFWTESTRGTLHLLRGGFAAGVLASPLDRSAGESITASILGGSRTRSSRYHVELRTCPPRDQISPIQM